MNKFLVIRCSNIDGINPIDEVDRVIAKRGHCWFGKYGNPIALPRTKNNKVKIYVALTGPSSKHKIGSVSVYVLKELCRTPPATKDDYPSYYKDRMYRVGTWVRVEPASSPSLELEQFVVKSSMQPLKLALQTSMRGHFWCLRRGDDDGFI